MKLKVFPVLHSQNYDFKFPHTTVMILERVFVRFTQNIINVRQCVR